MTHCILQCLILVYTVCSGLSVQILTINTLFLYKKICYGHSIESTYLVDSNEYMYHNIRLWRNKKNINICFWQKTPFIWSPGLFSLSWSFLYPSFCSLSSCWWCTTSRFTCEKKKNVKPWILEHLNSEVSNTAINGNEPFISPRYVAK